MYVRSIPQQTDLLQLHKQNWIRDWKGELNKKRGRDRQKDRQTIYDFFQSLIVVIGLLSISIRALIEMQINFYLLLRNIFIVCFKLKTLLHLFQIIESRKVLWNNSIKKQSFRSTINKKVSVNKLGSTNKNSKSNCLKKPFLLSIVVGELKKPFIYKVNLYKMTAILNKRVTLKICFNCNVILFSMWSFTI